MEKKRKLALKRCDSGTALLKSPWLLSEISYLAGYRLKTPCMANFNYSQFRKSLKSRKVLMLPFIM